MIGAQNSSFSLLDNRMDIGIALTQKFQQLFSSKGSSCPLNLDGLVLPKVETSCLPHLLALPSDNEIKEVLFGMDPNKAPGSDSMPGLFF